MEKIKQLQQDFADFMAQRNFNGQPTELYEPIAYTILQSGKRMRPMLCLLANDMFDGDKQQALWPSLALETFHNFTLIHDDIMDKAPMRRGKPTVYQKWNSDIAILSGDAMLAMAFQFALKPQKGAELAQQLGKVAIEICEGQQMDLNFETLGNVTIDEYLEMIRLKTAVLLATALQMGATTAEADKSDIQHLYDFGINMGMSFQLQDDILDLYSDVAVFGKRHGGDIADNKKTYLYLKALELASEQDRKRLEYLFTLRMDHDEEEKIEEVQAIYDRLHVKEAVEQVIAEYDRKALAELEAIDLPEERKIHLRNYAELLSGRKK
ncbi:MAG: polyprenyl synthetase family protein [Bacteroidales bacterium]|jgi:geranylgeranyl diphosphate synthase type II|nr:polyprenyl synthetase family protein [Bacteroidales bacterium]MBR6928906.1 polyprenyl synthetase family protein [Bacteroidales bacterium]